MFVQNNNSNNIFDYISLPIYIYIDLGVSEMNGSNDTRDKKEKLGIF